MHKIFLNILVVRGHAEIKQLAGHQDETSGLMVAGVC